MTDSGPAADPFKSGVREAVWVLVAITAAALLVRLLFLGIFPDVQNDEGLWTNPAKNRVLFGDWFLDGRNHFFLSPVYNLAAWISFAVLGPSIEAGRVVSALAGAGTVGLVGLLAGALTGNARVGLLAALVMALDPWAVISSRQAMVEPVLLLFLVACAWLLIVGGRWVIAAGLAGGLAVLCKLTAAPLVAAFGVFLLLRPGLAGRERVQRFLLFGSLAVLVSALGYGLAYLVGPERFVEVFARELGGEHVREDASGGGGLLGRLALSPVAAGLSVLEVVRMNPLLFSIGSLGLLLMAFEDWRRWSLPLVWFVVGMTFPLTQVYQPIRYFFVIVPPLAVGTGFLLDRVSRGSPTASPRALAAATVGFVLAFNAAYLGANFVANRSDRVQTVASWVHGNVPAEAAVSASPHFATDLRNPVYPPDLLGEDWSFARAAALDRGIGIFIWDEDEWTTEARRDLEREFRLLQDFGFAAVFAR